MAKVDKWEKLADDVKQLRDNLIAIPNLTAEQCGEVMAYDTVRARMLRYAALEKKLDKV